MTTAKIIKLGNGSTTYIPITSTQAIQHHYGNSNVVLESYLGGLQANITKNAGDISTLANAVINTYTKIVDYENSYVKPVSGHADQIMVYLPTTGANKYQETITINNVAHATAADTATNLTAAPTLDGSTAILTVGGKESAAMKAGVTAYGFTKVETAPTAGSTNAISSGYVKTLANTVDGKAATDHTHGLAWDTSAKTDNAGTEITALVAVPSSTITLGTTSQTATFTTYTLPTKKYVDDAVTSAFADVASALKYKGTIGTGTVTATHVNSLPPSHDVGDVWVVSSDGTYAGKACEVGDYIVCNTKGTTATDAHWDVLNGENQVSQTSINKTIQVGGGEQTIATVDGTEIKLSITQEANVVKKIDLTSYVNALNNNAGTGVVTGAKLETNGGGNKLTLSYSSISTLIPNVQDPTANGTSVTFIDAISQTNGKITATKKTVSTMSGASTSAAGAVGLVPAPEKMTEGETVKVLGADGNWKTITASVNNTNQSLTNNIKYAESNKTVEIDESLFGKFGTVGDVVAISTANPSVTVAVQ